MTDLDDLELLIDVTDFKSSKLKCDFKSSN